MTPITTIGITPAGPSIVSVEDRRDDEQQAETKSGFLAKPEDREKQNGECEEPIGGKNHWFKKGCVPVRLWAGRFPDKAAQLFQNFLPTFARPSDS